MNFKQADWRAVNGTCLQGYVDVDYATLVEIFGQPHSDGDGYKVDAEWMIVFSDGVIATIYNWKDGKNYNGEFGTPVEHIRSWHVGGKTARAVQYVEGVIEDFYIV